MNKWCSFVKAYYEKMKKENPNYTYSQALKDASKIYKKN